MSTLEFNRTIEVPYPFAIEEYDASALFFERETLDDAPISWKPGCRIESGYRPHTGEWSASEADAMGFMLLTPISAHKPSPRHAERIFYVRQWRDPSGNQWGSTRLRVTTKGAFTRLLGGFRHKFSIAKSKDREAADA